MKKLVTLVFALAILAIAGMLAFVYSGVYNVAATVPHTALVHWLASTMSDRSVAVRAGGIQVPNLAEPGRLKEGLEHFNAMCVTCHGAPGVAPEEWAGGLYPPAPDLADSARDLTPQEVFWILKNGIKMTGMPAFGPSHDDQKLWDMVAVVKNLPDWGADGYARQLQDAGVAVTTHEHGDGDAATGESEHATEHGSS